MNKKSASCICTFWHPSFIGVLWKVGAFASFAALNALTRLLTIGQAHGIVFEPLSVPTIVFFQDVCAFILVLPWVFRQGVFNQRPPHLRLQLIRVVFSALGVIGWVYVLYFMPQAQAVALSIIGPLIGVAMAKLYLRESVGRLKLSVIFLSFSLVCYGLNPLKAIEANLDNWKGLGLIVLSTTSFALAKVLTRKLTTLGQSPQRLTAYLLTLIVPVSFLFATFSWKLPSFEHLPWLGLAGLFTLLGIFSTAMALKYAQVSFLAPFDIIRFILNALIGYWAFTELVPVWAIGVVVVAMVVFSVNFMYNREVRAIGSL